MNLYLDLIIWPFLAAVVISGIHVYLGMHVVSRGVIFVDLALAQMAALGTAVGILIGLDPASTTTLVLAVLFTLVGAALFASIRSISNRIPSEAIIGITYVVAAALMILLFSHSAEGAEEVNHLLVGSILFVTPLQVGEIFIIYSIIGLLHYRFRHQFMATSRFRSEKLPPPKNSHLWDFLFYVTFGIVVTLSVKIAGVLLVFSFLIIPSVAALFFMDSPLRRMIYGWVFSLAGSVLGMFFSILFDTPTGTTVVVTLGLLLTLNTLIYLLKNKQLSG